MEGHAQHVSQGTPAFFGNPFFRRPIYLMTENEKGEAGDTFDTKLLAEPITSLAARFPSLQALMAPGLASADQALAAAEKSALEADRAAAAKSLAEAGKAIAGLRAQINQQSGAEAAAALWEIDRVRDRIDRALADDVALTVDVEADRHELLVAGEDFAVDARSYDRTAVATKWTVDKSSLEMPRGWTATIKGPEGENNEYHFQVSIPAGAEPPSSPGDAILPFPPPIVQLNLHAEVDGYDFAMEKPVESVAAATTGIRMYQLELVPAVTLTVEPQQVMVPEKRTAMPVKLLARVRYHGPKAAEVSVGLDAPKGWSVAPIAPLDFSAAGDQLIQFIVTPPAQTAPERIRCIPTHGWETRRFNVARADPNTADARLERAGRRHGTRAEPGDSDRAAHRLHNRGN